MHLDAIKWVGERGRRDVSCVDVNEKDRGRGDRCEDADACNGSTQEPEIENRKNTRRRGRYESENEGVRR